MEFNSSKKDRSFNFGCKLKRDAQDINYIYLNLYDFNQPSGQKDQRGITKFPQSLDLLREFDLVLISEKEIDSKASLDSEFLNKIGQEQGQWLAVVRAPRKNDHNFIKIKVDNMHEEYFCLNQLQIFDSNLHCYFLGSLMTTVREFRTIKNCEFFHTGPIIFDPKLALT